MTAVVQFSGSRSFPALRYRDVGFAARWLCAAFGFEQHSATVDVQGCVNYAELSFGNTIIILGATGGFEVDTLLRQPDEVGGAETQCSYYLVSDLDVHYARAFDAGAKIVLEIKTHANGTRGYTCRDPEGHLWNFGTYDPWHRADDAIDAARSVKSDVSSGLGLGAQESESTSSHFPKRLAAGISIPLITLGLIFAWACGAPWQTAREAVAAPASLVGPDRINPHPNEQAYLTIEEVHRLLAFERTTRRIAARRSAASEEEAVRERSLRVAAEQAAHELAQKLSNAQRAKDLAVSATNSAQQQLAEERNGAAVEKARTTHEMNVALADERSAKEDAQRAAAETKAQLSEAQAATAAAAQAAREANFIAQSAKKSAAEPLEDVRKQVINEQAARSVAELAAREARDELVLERNSRQAAWRAVGQLKKQLAMVEGGSQPGPVTCPTCDPAHADGQLDAEPIAAPISTAAISPAPDRVPDRAPPVSAAETILRAGKELTDKGPPRTEIAVATMESGPEAPPPPVSDTTLASKDNTGVEPEKPTSRASPSHKQVSVKQRRARARTPVPPNATPPSSKLYSPDNYAQVPGWAAKMFETPWQNKAFAFR